MANATHDAHVRVDEVKIPVPWGHVSAQVFSNTALTSRAHSQPIVCVHGYLDNSNSFKPLAGHICQTTDYYMVAVDLPGHGLSSHMPRGVAYTFKFMLQALRTAIVHMGLRDFVFLSHSYGVGQSYMYQTVFPGEVRASVALDWVFGTPTKIRDNFARHWREGITSYIRNNDAEMAAERARRAETRGKLTRARALEILLKANKSLDEKSASILLERALVEKGDDEFDFRRDLNVKLSLNLRDHYLEALMLMPELKTTFTAPGLFLTVVPPSYGPTAQQFTLELIHDIQRGSSADLEIVEFNGTHHFHMIHAKQVAELVLKFLDRLAKKPVSKV